MPFTFLPLLLASVQPTTLEIDLDGLRNSKGVIQACITREQRHFPDCKADAGAIRQTVPAHAARLLFNDLPPGDYAVALFHDENANGKLDTLLGIPREGFGFSRNPIVRFGAPRYDQVSMQLAAGFTRIHVRVQYLL